MPTLRSTLNALATNLASDIVDAIRSSSLEELLGERGGHPGRAWACPRSTCGEIFVSRGISAEATATGSTTSGTLRW
jgi:hypothetical protein